MSDDKLVQLGEIIGVHGVQGAMTIRSFTRPRDNILEYSEWVLSDPQSELQQAVTVAEAGWIGKRLVVQLKGAEGDRYEDRDRAAALIGWSISVSRTALPKAPDDEFYWTDLIGLAVTTTEGIELGVVSGMMETGAHDVLVIDGERKRLLPFVRPEIVKAVDLAAGSMQVEWDHSFE